MTKKFTVAISILFLLSSCISIKRNASTPIPQQFVTATLAPTTANWMPAATTIPMETEVPVLMMTVPPNCTNSAVLLRDVTIPDDTRVTAGEIFTKTWEFQNTGTCSWTGYTIQFSSGDQMSAPLSTPIADTPPSGKVQISMDLTAPTADGRYAGYFTLHNSNGDAIPIGTQKAFWVKFIVGNLAAGSSVSGTNSVPSGNCRYGPNADYVNQILSLINTERMNAGLSTLAFDEVIAAFAQSHAEEMAYNNFLSHNGLNASFGERMMQFSLLQTGRQISGEILAIGTPQNAMDQWRMDEHWDYVLGSGYTLIGVGYAYNSCSDYGGYFTVDFGH